MSGKGRAYPSLAVRFAQKLDKTPGFGPSGDCWRGAGAYVGTKLRYGQIARSKADGGRREYAHRVAYELHYNVSLVAVRDGGPLVLHRCDNPACVNPDHLFLGTFRDNTQDMLAKGRCVRADQRGEANNSHKLTTSQVLQIRASKEPCSRLAVRFGISESWAWSVRAGEAWAHLDDLPNREGVFA